MNNKYINIFSINTLINIVMVCLAIFMAGSVIADEENAEQYNTSSMSLSLDNDAFLGTDRGYTNGIFFKFNSNSTTDINENSPLALKAIDSFLPLNQQSNKGWGVSIGQQIWTPVDITSPTENANDRPYTGLLFIEARVFEFSEELSNKYSLMLGAVGPDTFGEDSQIFVHSLIGSPQPKGWARQIKSQTVYNLGYEGQRLLTREDGWLDRDYDAGLSGRVNVGNYQSEVALGTTLRWGDALNESFASVGATPGHYIDSSVLSKSRSGQFYYLAIEGRYRFQDITIDGARPKHLFDVHTEHWQATLSTGLVYYQATWGMAFSVITSTPDYEEDLRDYNSTASIEIFWRV
jgi:hypothetical protein